jgi:predicted CXXCH cytochrome family protein
MVWRRSILTTASLLLALAVAPGAAGAPHSWRIDAAKFHISAHGQLSCSTCHDSVASNAAHPDPRNVNQPPARPDPAEGCWVCHDAVRAGVALGKHGRMKEQHAGQFRNCVSCHNPHTVINAADRQSGHITAAKPPREQCGACHAARQELPKPAADDARCWSCHDEHADLRERNAPLCLYCHADGKSDAQVATGRVSTSIDAAAYSRTPHAIVACATCHANAAAYGHAHQAEGNCLRCHAPHYAQARDPHVNVECRACHVSGGRMVLAGGRVVRERVPAPGPATRTHAMQRRPSRQACERCHFDGNQVGASAMVLPARGILCVGCHAATLSVNDAVTIPSLLVFLLGLAAAVSLWLSGSGSLIGGLKPRLLVALKSLLMDTILQRRLRRQSPARWAIHSLIFLPFVVRFAWGMVALVGSWMGAHGAWFGVLIDKNHPANALFFDLTGLSVLVGVCAATARGIATRRQQVPGPPGQDRAALALIGSVVAIGFVLEGMRMTMTGTSGGSAFVGYAISRAFTAGPALGRAYGYVWYLHAALTGAFVAYLPFSRMFHILVAPAALAARAVRRESHAAHAAGD